MGYIVLVVIAALGWGVLKLLRFPVAPLLGPMIFIATAKMLGASLPVLPAFSTTIFQVILGLFVGNKIDRDKVMFLKGVFYSTLLTVVWTIAFSLITTVLLVSFTNLDVPTALFGGAPGGIAEMSIIALPYKADVAIVAFLQFLRVMLIVFFFSILASKGSKAGLNETAAAGETEPAWALKKENSFYLENIISGAGLGLLFTSINIPAGGLVGAVIGVGAANIALGKSTSLPKYFHQMAQLGVGMTIGLQFSGQTFGHFTGILVPVILFSISIVLSGVLLAYVLKIITKWDFITCLLCSAPAGISQMIIMADDLGADVIKVSYFQVIRLLTVFLVLQQLFFWYLN